MKVLVLGGSYFYGRVFTIVSAEKHELTLWNRGTYSMKEFGVEELVGERRNPALLQQISSMDFDAVVDFCAYEKEDVSTLIESLPQSVKQYILISTVDVYERGTGQVHSEDFPYEEREIQGDAGRYIAGKIAAEKECVRACRENKIAYTILRPAILYGPYNYAPRESSWIQIMLQNHLVPQPIDATGRFQLVYIKDAAVAVEKCLGAEQVYNQKINLCGEETDYRQFCEELAKASGFPLAEMTVQQAEAVGLPLPFPVFAEETEISDGALAKKLLKLEYTPLSIGMEKTYRAFSRVFQ